jgi:hypothetical protein
MLFFCSMFIPSLAFVLKLVSGDDREAPAAFAYRLESPDASPG